jgi:TolB-like protein
VQAAPAPTADPRRAPILAVRPFEILSPDASHELFARGLEEDVLAALSRFRHLHVLGPAADRRAADGERGAEADYLLLGSIRASAGRLRVNARLVDGRSGAEIWGERAEADLADVFSVQDRIAGAVVATLAARIDEAELAQALRQPGATVDAYGCWLRGMRSVRVGTREADLEARRHFERALSIDPAYARAYSGLSLSHFNDWSCAAWERWDENERLAFEYATQATRLDERDHVTHCILGRILLYRREFARAAEHFDRALALNRNDPDVLAHLALGHAYLGDPERGLELGLAARRLNPVHADWYFPCIAANHFVARRPREGLELVERAPDGHVDTRAFMAAAYGHLGEAARAREHAAKFLERFRGGIVRDGTAADAVSWMLRVNPFRREEDLAYLLDGLSRAGLPAAG